jgi:hypothetical protein
MLDFISLICWNKIKIKKYYFHDLSFIVMLLFYRIGVNIIVLVLEIIN